MKTLKNISLLAIVALGFLVALAPAPSGLMDRATIQAQLDVDRLKGNPNGRVPCGVTVELPAGEIVLDKPLSITSAGRLIGQGRRTVIIWNGPPGTAAIQVGTELSHKTVKDVLIERVDFYCPQGGDAIAKAPGTNVIESLVVRDSYVNGGKINLPGENYRCLLEDIRFLEPRGQALRFDGAANVMNRVQLSGGMFPGAKSPTCMIETHGSVELDGFCWFEGAFGCSLLEAYGANGFRGSVTVGGNAWIENHSQCNTVRLTDVDYYGSNVSGNWQDKKWLLTRSTINLPVELK